MGKQQKQKKSFEDQLKELAKKRFDMELDMTETNTQQPEQIIVDHIENISPDRRARAPYNFIPLNKTLIENGKPPAFNIYHNERFTGYIKINLTTKTPIYIRDTIDKKENDAKKESKDISSFFSPGGEIRIPGSSLRGMIRTLVEIISYGNFGYFDEKRFYFRAVADQSNLRFLYTDTMVDENDNYYPKVKAGILRYDKSTDKYYIHPSKVDPGTQTQIYRINFTQYTREVKVITFILNEFENKEIYFKPVPTQLHDHFRFNQVTRRKDIPYKLKYALLPEVSEKHDPVNYPQKGYIISSGDIKGKHMHWVVAEEDTTKNGIPLHDNLVKDYAKDINRKEEINLLEEAKNNRNGTPCFYIDDGSGNVFSFGHTGLFRLAYETTLQNHIPAKKEVIDISEAIFGNEKTFAGRVFFEDAFLNGSTNDNSTLGEKTPHILANPKPTTFQHYLVQSPDDRVKKLNHYDSKVSGELAAIRGNKFYWHKQSNNWIQADPNEIQQHTSQYTKINPIKDNIDFIGKIRFENLSAVELGALLTALELPEGCYHKIGMAKPYGLGSIEIKPTLHLSKHKKRYQSLINEWMIELPESIAANETKEDYKDKFADLVMNKISDKPPGEAKYKNHDLWEVKRLKELKRMLTFNHGIDENNISYMSIKKPVFNEDGTPKLKKGKHETKNEFADRKILPLPSKVE